MTDPSLALASTRRLLAARGLPYALVGGLVDFAVAVDDDTGAEALIFVACQQGYTPVATIEHERHGRLATVRLRSPHEIAIDLLFASTGIEAEISERATIVDVLGKIE